MYKSSLWTEYELKCLPTLRSCHFWYGRPSPARPSNPRIWSDDWRDLSSSRTTLNCIDIVIKGVQCMFVVVHCMVQSPQFEVLVFRTTHEPVFNDCQSSHWVQMGRLKGRKNVPRTNIHPSDAVVASSIVENFVCRSLYNWIGTKVKISWFFYFSSKAWLGFSFLKSHTSKLPLLGDPLPPVKTKSPYPWMVCTWSLWPLRTALT